MNYWRFYTSIWTGWRMSWWHIQSNEINYGIDNSVCLLKLINFGRKKKELNQKSFIIYSEWIASREQNNGMKSNHLRYISVISVRSYLDYIVWYFRPIRCRTIQYNQEWSKLNERKRESEIQKKYRRYREKRRTAVERRTKQEFNSNKSIK